MLLKALLYFPPLASLGIYFFFERPEILIPLVWGLGYLHVIYSFGHAFDKNNFSKHPKLFYYSGALIVCTGLTIFYYNPIVLNTVYFLFFSLYHYPRQTEGIVKTMTEKISSLDRIMLYWPVVVGILVRFEGKSEPIAGINVYLPSLNSNFQEILQVLFWASFCYWAIQKGLGLRKARTIRNSEIILFSHVLLMIISFLLIQNFLYSFIVASTFHYLQYIIFSRDYVKFSFFPKALLATSIIYLPIFFYDPKNISGLNYFYIYVMILNFLHYMIDSIIWKKKYGYIKTSPI